MAQDQNQNPEEVLIARNNETGQVGAVTGLNEDGTPKMTDVKSAKISDLVKFQKGQNPLEAFMSNFVRQCKNPSTFGFFRVPADRYDTVGTVIGDLAKDPVANAEMLKNNKVELPTAEQKVEQPQQAAAAEEQPAQANVTGNEQTPDKEVKHSAIDASRIDWATLKEKWGIDRAELEKSGDLKEMLYNRKSKIVTVTPTFAGEKFPIDARLSFRTDPDGSVKLVPHFIHREARLDQDFMGYKFSKDEKAVLRETGNLGKVVELTGRNGEKVPSYVSIDRYTNELVSVPVKDVFVRNTVGQTKLTDAEVAQLKQGMALPPKEITDKNGKTYNVLLQVSADRKGVEFVPDSGRRHEQREQQTQGQKPSSWITADGRIKPLSKWCKVPMTQQQQADYAAGKVVELTNIPDKNGKLNTVYLQFNPEKQRPTTSLNDPRVTVAEESRTQKAVNTDGLTNEATKHVAEPIQKYQTAPKNEAQQQQQRKPKGPKM
jgi:hypothetical protein